jgi:hypothetical protein
VTSPYSFAGGGSGGGSDATKVPLYTTQAKTASFTAAAGFVYLVDTTSGAVTATLPAANVAGQQIVVKFNAGANPVTVVPTGTDTIGAAATTASITLAAEVWEFVSSGAGQWNLVAGNKSLASLDLRYAALRRPGLAAQWTTLTNRPLLVPSTGTGTLAKDSWRYLPLRLLEDLPVDALAITTTVAATGGTAALIFGLMVADSTNRPLTRQTDYSTYGAIDLTATAGVQQLATVGLTIPAGEWYLALAWTGTATGAPTVTTVTGYHPSIGNVAAVAAATAYLQSLSGAAVPASATPSTTATAAPLVHCKIR